jgi:hypothetical protein
MGYAITFPICLLSASGNNIGCNSPTHSGDYGATSAVEVGLKRKKLIDSALGNGISQEENIYSQLKSLSVNLDLQFPH